MLTAPPRQLSAIDRAARARTAGVLGVLLAAAALVDPNRPLPIDLCVLKSLTGVPCPTCGLTRAICHALHGDFTTSLGLHPAGLIALALLVGWGTWAALESWRGRPLWDDLQRPIVRAAAYAGVAVTAVVWILRLSAV